MLQYIVEQYIYSVTIPSQHKFLSLMISLMYIWMRDGSDVAKCWLRETKLPVDIWLANKGVSQFWTYTVTSVRYQILNE